MARQTVKLDGFRDLENALEDLGKRTGKSTLRRAGAKALAPMIEDAKRRAPRDEGDLAESGTVGTKLSPRQRRGAARFARQHTTVVYGGFGPLPQAHLVEFGTVNQPARPFLRPAWVAHRDGLLDTVKDELRNEIDKAVARAAKRAAKPR